MAKLRLAEAIRLGSLVTTKPKQFELRACAIGMALRANGIPELDIRDLDDTTPEHPEDGYVKLGQLYPWVEHIDSTCPRCKNSRVIAAYAIYHPFDHHVLGLKDMTLEQLCDWIDSIDPTPRAIDEYIAMEESPVETETVNA